ncbi:MAG: DNRLRE domain-containing protein [Candidatus Cloacimonetes bacterium]|nr:DNRLRE domain-containing protein [Candidatus Cloacimonadota bacterium]
MKGKIYFIVTVLIIAFVSLANADTITIEPCDDMYTDVEHPTTPPTTTQLWVAEFSGAGHFERIMIQLDLIELENATIEDATLHLYRFFSCPQTGTTATSFYAITEEWNEETWDPHTHIQYDPYVWISHTFSGPGGNYGMWFEVDITDLVQAWVDSQIENHGFVIKAQTGNKWSKFYSKEYSNSNLHPYLVVNYTPVSINDNLIQETIINLQNYPNPFKPSGAGHSPTTTISFNITAKNAENAEIIIYNLKGQVVKTFLLRNPSSIIPNQIIWDGRDESNNPVASGIYFYQIKSANSVKMNKMILMK